jgi:hypothetical protein
MKDPIKHFGFNPQNYKWLYIGLAINILGYILMIGGGTDDPTKFDADVLFSTTRIKIAPILIVAGYVVILFSIMKKSPSNQSGDVLSNENDIDLKKKSK